jgi:hypothetical protein
VYLDQDEGGKKHTLQALQWDKKYLDNSHLYKQYKDLNEYLVHQSLQQKQSKGLRIRH